MMQLYDGVFILLDTISEIRTHSIDVNARITNSIMSVSSLYKFFKSINNK